MRLFWKSPRWSGWGNDSDVDDDDHHDDHHDDDHHIEDYLDGHDPSEVDDNNGTSVTASINTMVSTMIMNTAETRWRNDGQGHSHSNYVYNHDIDNYDNGNPMNS